MKLVPLYQLNGLTRVAKRRCAITGTAAEDSLLCRSHGDYTGVVDIEELERKRLLTHDARINV